MSSVSKLAFMSIRTFSFFFPSSTHFSFIFSFVNFLWIVFLRWRVIVFWSLMYWSISLVFVVFFILRWSVLYESIEIVVFWSKKVLRIVLSFIVGTFTIWNISITEFSGTRVRVSPKTDLYIILLSLTVLVFISVYESGFFIWIKRWSFHFYILMCFVKK